MCDIATVVLTSRFKLSNLFYINIGKAALDAGKTAAVEAGKRVVEKVINPLKIGIKKIEQIVSKYTKNDSAVDIQDLEKKLN